MARHLFFSWQADTPNTVGRNFLRATLETVCKELAEGADLDEAARDLTVDSDTQDVAGQPPIAETIFKKIDGAAVVIADMTLTGQRPDGRPTPNPNVLIEYGWALKSLGYSRVITIMNTAYGQPSAENLPFDLAHLRWPMRYNLASDAEPSAKAEEKRRLTRELKAAVQASLATVPQSTHGPALFNEAPSKNGPARFRASDEALGFDEDPVIGHGREVFLKQGSAVWLRVMPALDPQKRWPTKQLLQVGLENSPLFPLSRRQGSYSYVRASDGLGIYCVLPSNDEKSKQIVADTIAFAFRSGEVWSVDVCLLAVDPEWVYYPRIEEALVNAAGRYRRFLKRLGIEGPYRWSAGLVGVKGRHLGFPPPPGRVWGDSAGPICASDHLESTGTLEDEQSAFDALLPLFEHIFEECGIEMPDYLAKQ